MRNNELTPEQARHVRLYRGYLVEFLHAKRDASGLSPETLSGRAGLDAKTYRRIENGEFLPNFKTLILIACALCGTAEDFFLAFAKYLQGHAEKKCKRLVGRYYSKEGSECFEVWRIEPRG